MISHFAQHAIQHKFLTTLCLFLFAACAAQIHAQSPGGPIAPRPDVPIQQPPQDKRARVKVQVALVNTPVTVRDSKGQMVDTLNAKDFHVTDNGVAQKIIHFDLGGDPLSIIILVENSSRIESMLPEIRKSGVLFSQTVMGPTGEAAVVSFNDSIDKLQDFTANADKIENAINHLQEGTSGAKLYDAMALGVEMLSTRPQPTADSPGRRRILLVVSEATDVGSEARLGEVLRSAQLNNITIYSVGLSTARGELATKPKDTTPQLSPPGTFPEPPIPGVPQTPTTEAYRYGSGDLLQAVMLAVTHVKDKLTGNPLEIAAAGTGGTHLATYKDRSIENAIDEIGGELHSQYSITYTPVGSSAFGYHEIKVSVDHKNLKVRFRPGYYLGESGS